MPDHPHRALRHLHVSEVYPPQYGGGAALVVRQAAHALASRGHFVHVVAMTTGGSAPYAVVNETDGPVTVSRIEGAPPQATDPEGWTMGLVRWRQHERRMAEAVLEVARAARPDVVTLHAVRTFGEETLLRLRQEGFPTVYLLHDAGPYCVRLHLRRSPGGRPCSGPSVMRCLLCNYSNYDSYPVAVAKLPWRLLRQGPLFAYRVGRRRRFGRSVSAYLSLSTAMLDLCRRHTGRPGRAFDLGLELPDPLPRRRPGSPFRFGFMGGGSAIKGSGILAAAVERLRGLYRGAFEVHVWGPAIERLPSNGSFLLRGSIPYERRFEAFAEMDALVVATIAVENSPVVIREAAACGVVSIGPDAGGVPELIRDGASGLLFKVGDAADLARAMATLVEDAEALERMRAALRRPPGLDAMGRELAAAYAALLEQVSE